MTLAHKVTSKLTGESDIQGDRKAPLPADVIEAVSVAIDGLVLSVEEGTVYKDLEGLRQYIQWTQDYSNYELALAAYRVDIVRKRDDMLESAIIQFHSKNGKLRQASVWHWCPLWQILTTDEGIMQKLPSLPWVHDGKNFCSNSVSRSLSFYFALSFTVLAF